MVGSLTGLLLLSKFLTVTLLAESSLSNMTSRMVEFHTPLTGGRMTTAPGRHDATVANRSQRLSNVIVDLVAEVESFTSTRLLQSVAELGENDVFSWVKRKSAWLKHGGADFDKLGKSWQTVEGFIEARNALQHGLGELTAFQLSPQHRRRVLNAIRNSSVWLDGSTVVLRQSDPERCAEASLEFVSALDCIGPGL